MADIFWTDTTQARERLANTVVMYDGEPVIILDILNGDDFDDRVPRAYMNYCSKLADTPQRKRLDSPKFNKFRDLPPLGFLNCPKYGAVLLERRAARSRLHGLCDTNVACWFFSKEHGYEMRRMDGGWKRYYTSEGFIESCKDVFPTLEEVLLNIKEVSSIAFSRKFAVYRDELGLRWLYRNEQRIGLFPNAKSLCLISKFKFYREEIMAEPKFTLDSIQEY